MVQHYVLYRNASPHEELVNDVEANEDEDESDNHSIMSSPTPSLRRDDPDHQD